MVKGRGVHTCPAGECARVVPDSMLACRAHWFELPAALRAAIWRSYRRGEVGEHRQLVMDAIDYWRELSSGGPLE